MYRPTATWNHGIPVSTEAERGKSSLVATHLENSSLRIPTATGAQTEQISLQKRSEIGAETVVHLNFVFCFVASCSDPDRGNRSGRDFLTGK